MKYLIIIISIFYSISLDAQVRVWAGGVGNWNVATNWVNPASPTVFTIPGPNDHVIINNNTSVSGLELVNIPHGYTAQVKSMEIGEDAYVNVGAAGGSGVVALRVWGAPNTAIDLNGFLRVWDDGVLSIRNGPVEGVKIGATGELDVKVGGFADIRANSGTLGTGILNEGHVITRQDNAGGEGVINIFDYSGKGVLNRSFSAIFENKGALLISDSNGANSTALESLNDADFTNTAEGRIVINNIEGTNSRGIRTDDRFTNEGSIQISRVNEASSITTESSAGLFYNANGATITISDSENDGIRSFNNSLFINDGDLILEDFTVDTRRGIRNQATFENRTTGTIKIQNSSGASWKGIVNEKTFDNEGQITITNVDSGFGVENAGNDAVFTNDAIINISGSGLDAIRNHTNALFLNFGTMSLTNTKYKSIANWTAATFTNNGGISISVDFGQAVEGINNRTGTFTNSALGTISINSLNGATTFGIHHDQGMFVNDGEVTIGSVVKGECILIEAGGFTNNGTMDLDKCGSHGVVIENGGLLTNKNTITIDDLNSANSDGIHIGITASFVNQKELAITNVTRDGLSTTWGFSNDVSGNIEILEFGRHGLLTSASIEAVNEGIISIVSNNSGGPSFGMMIPGLMTNKGTIEISGLVGIARGVDLAGTLENQGLLDIDQVAGDGISISATGTLNNTAAGNIQINDTDKGILNFNELKNEIDAVIITSNTDEPGIYNSSNLENYGLIDLGGSLMSTFFIQEGQVDNYGEIKVNGVNIPFDMVINSGGTLVNHLCAKVSMKGTVAIQGMISNQGFFKVEGSEMSNLFGTMNNTGVITDYQGSFKSYLSTSNTFGGIYAGPLFGYHVLGVTSYTPLIVNGGNNDVGEEYFSFDNLTFPAGRYDKDQNTWLPSQLNIDEVFIEISQVNQGQVCTQLISQQLIDAPILGTCSEVPSTYLPTSRSSSVWHNPFHWTTTQVPTMCTKALLTTDRETVVEPIFDGKVKELEVQDASSLIIYNTFTVGNN